MRRADRLFQIVQILRRRRRKATTAREIAGELEVSVRTVYRDVQDLIVSGVPVDGEAGTGYLLRDGYHLPPLMFSGDELEAIVLGMQIVAAWSDPELARAAADVLSKIETALPERLRAELLQVAICAPSDHYREPITVDMPALRRATKAKTKIKLLYEKPESKASTRIVWPLALCFYGPVWLLVAWCESKSDFRVFRLDRMREAEVLAEKFEPKRGQRLEDYLRSQNVAHHELIP
jgi:predicted DNA-binding transcriptional regulator YafY